jgi:hypothetical protein
VYNQDVKKFQIHQIEAISVKDLMNKPTTTMENISP